MRKMLKVMKGKIGKIALAMVVTLTCLSTFGSVAEAYHYYDGGSSNFTTYGQEENSYATGGGEDKEVNYKIKELVRRYGTTNLSSQGVNVATYVANYKNNTTGWKYRDPSSDSLDKFNMSKSVCNTIPSDWSHVFRVKDDGVVYYTCSGCGYTDAYVVDFTQYGYYDENGKAYFKGYSGYLYCPKCSDINRTKERYIFEGQTTLGEDVPGATYRVHSKSNGFWQGVYVYPELRSRYNKYILTTDPAFISETGDMPYYKFLEMVSQYNYTPMKDANVKGGMDECTSYIDASQNGRFVRHKGASIKALSGPQEFVQLKYDPNVYTGWEYAIKITEPLSNNAVPKQGYHSYKKYHDYINFSYWRLSSHGMCIHSEKNQNVFVMASYNGKSLGTDGWGFSNKWGKCGRDYEKGYIGVCSDCGQDVTALLYGSPETVSSIRRVENGVEYMYFCPYGIGNMKIGNKTFYYLHSQVENQWQFYHACYAIGKNQYKLQFESNSPDKSFFPDTTSIEGGYFYDTYKDGEDVPYVSDVTTLPYGYAEPTVKSKNTIGNPTWDNKGYIFKYWSVYNEKTKSWINLDTTPTWEEVVSKIDPSQLATDGNVIRLRANWETPSRTVNVVDGDEIKNGTSLTSAKVLNSYNVKYMRSVTLETRSGKTGKVSFQYPKQSNLVPPTDKATSASFVGYEGWANNKGIFDTSSRVYLNTQPDSNTDYIIANYSWNTIALPSPVSDSAVFVGWYSNSSLEDKYLVGAGGAPYTPTSSNVTLYGKWSPDDMVISAEVTDHTNGTSHVSWIYSNAEINANYYYKIYRDDVLITNGTSLGSSVTEENLGVALTSSNGSHTIVTEGIYTITLEGSPGESATIGSMTAKGGKGATYTLTMHLQKGDKLNWYLSDGSKNTYDSSKYAGKTGNLYGNKDGKYGNGGAASVLVLTRGGKASVVAVASGGAGGLILGDVKNGTSVNGTVTTYRFLDGGNAQTHDALSQNGITNPYSNFSDYQNEGYNTIVSGAGGGKYHGNNGMIIAYQKAYVHTHTAPTGATLVSGTANKSDAKYNISGGCYQKAVVCGGKVEQTSFKKFSHNYCGRCHKNSSGQWECSGTCVQCGNSSGHCSHPYYSGSDIWTCKECGKTFTSSRTNCDKTVYGLSCTEPDTPHVHTAPSSNNLLAGTHNNSSSAVYSVSGGCYTSEKDRYEMVTLTMHSSHTYNDGTTLTFNSSHISSYQKYTDLYGNKKTPSLVNNSVKFTGRLVSGSNTTKTFKFFVDRITGKLGNRDEGCCNPPRKNIVCEHTKITDTNPTAKVYIFNCTKTTGKYGETNILNGFPYVEASPTGGACWYDKSLVLSAEFKPNNTDTKGSFKMDATLVGITSERSLDDTETDDVAPPNAPGKGKDLEVLSEIKNDRVYFTMSNIQWLVATDNGTKYSFYGETWGKVHPSTRFAYTKNKATVTVTSGIKHYEWAIVDTNNKVVSGHSGTTKNLYLDDKPLVSCGIKENFEVTYKLRIIAVDNANNKSKPLEIPLKAKWDWDDEIIPQEHFPGDLKNPELSVNNPSDDGVYQSGGVYYVKADGFTKIRLKGVAELDPVKKSRIVQVTLTDTADNSINKGYIVKTPLLNHNKNNTTNGGSIGTLVDFGDVTTLEINNESTTFVQNFVTTNENNTSVKIVASSDCLGGENNGCVIDSHKYLKEGNTITIKGDNTAPSIQFGTTKDNIGGTSYSGEKFSNTYEYDWSDQREVWFTVKDNGSGIKSIKVSTATNPKEYSYTADTRTTDLKEQKITITTEGEQTLQFDIEDNVGNVTVMKVVVKIDLSKPSVTDTINGISENNVEVKSEPFAPNQKGTWSTTYTNTMWEYDWVTKDFELSYVTKDEVSGIKSFKLYKANASWGKASTTPIANGTVINECNQSISYTVTTEGTSYYILESVDNKGNQITVYIVVHIDKKAPKLHNASTYPTTMNLLDGLTIQKVNDIVEGRASIDELSYKWTLRWQDVKDTSNVNDTSGIASATLYIYDVDTPSIAKSYEMKPSSYQTYTTQKSHNKFASELVDENGKNILRYSDVTFQISVNTLLDFPNSSQLGWRIVGYDNAGNRFAKEGPTVLNNFGIKAVAYATKEDGYNIATSDGKSNTPYFKTGEVGFVEVWTVGYVEQFEMSYGSTKNVVAANARDEIKRGTYLDKYILGHSSFSEVDRRYVTTLLEHRTNINVANIVLSEKTVPFATHYKYSFDEVNQSVGTSNTSGWKSDGTMMRIPPNYKLQPKLDGYGKPMFDKNGNALYVWELHDVEVIAYKGSITDKSKLPRSIANYVIWDEAGDDIHYRITHQTFGY